MRRTSPSHGVEVDLVFVIGNEQDIESVSTLVIVKVCIALVGRLDVQWEMRAVHVADTLWKGGLLADSSFDHLAPVLIWPLDPVILYAEKGHNDSPHPHHTRSLCNAKKFSVPS